MAAPLTVDDYNALVEVPEPNVIYRKDTPGQTIHEWFPLWTSHDFPGLFRVWRDPMGGWTRWLCFEDPDGITHALRVTTYREGNTVEENVYLRAISVKIGHRNITRPDP